MKKISIGLLVLMLIGMAMFVSCSNEPKSMDDGVGSVKFIGSDSASASRGLTRINPKFDAASMVWKYEAKKTDTSGLKTGETNGKTLLGTDGKISNVEGPFSQGIWEFTLYAYESMDKVNADEYAYKGIASSVKITSAATNSVKVTVDAQQNGNGYIEVARNITLQDANGNSISEHNEKIILTSLKDNSNSVEYINSSERKFEVASGAWKVNVIFYDTQNPEIIYGNNVIYVNVYDNLTTKVGGSLDEITASTKFFTESGVTTAVSVPVEMTASEENKLSVESTPAAIQDPDNKTEVAIPAGAVSTTAGDKAVLSVTPYVAKDAESMFSAQLEGSGTAVAGLDITVAINDSPVTNFAESITITTYIAKGITGDVTVKYNGEGAQPEYVTYDPRSGMLTFKTTHLSEYYVVANAAAINTTTNTAYVTLAAALESTGEGETLVLLKDFANPIDSNAVNFTLQKNAVLDGNGHTLEGNVSVNVNAGGGTVQNIVFKNIHNNSQLSDKEKNQYKTKDKIGKMTALYASGLSGKLVVKDCTFDTIDWDAIQITPVDNSDIAIIGNTFKFNKDSENGITDPIRYIHVQSGNNTNFRILITDNKLFNCAELNQTGIEVYFPSDLSKVNLQGNYIDAPFAVCICKNSWDSSNFCPELVLPFSAGPDGEAAFVPVCWSVDSNGNQHFYSGLQTAINESTGKITLLSDVSLEKVLQIGKSITIDGGNHSLQPNNKMDMIVIDGNQIEVTIKNLNMSYCEYTGLDGIKCGADNSKITINNVNISSCFKALHFNDCRNTDVIIKDSKLESIYPFNVNGGDMKSFNVDNSVLNGWTSFSKPTNDMTYTFSNCQFGKGYGYATLKPYGNTKLENCDFSTDYFKNLEGGIASGTETPIDVYFNSCTINGQRLTVELLKDMFNYDITSGSSSGDSTIEEQNWYIDNTRIGFAATT